jgi:hypothetical protein
VVALSRNASSFLSPNPATFLRSSTVAKRPLASLQSTIRPASSGPTPGRSSSSSAVARLRLMSPPASAVPLPGIPATGGGGSSPSFGTMICSPSVRNRARLSCASSARSVSPPAAATTSIARSPACSSYRPGVTTSPRMWTNIVADAGAPDGSVSPAASGTPSVSDVAGPSGARRVADVPAPGTTVSVAPCGPRVATTTVMAMPSRSSTMAAPMVRRRRGRAGAGEVVRPREAREAVETGEASMPEH